MQILEQHFLSLNSNSLICFLSMVMHQIMYFGVITWLVFHRLRGLCLECAVSSFAIFFYKICQSIVFIHRLLLDQSHLMNPVLLLRDRTATYMNMMTHDIGKTRQHDITNVTRIWWFPQHRTQYSKPNITILETVLLKTKFNFRVLSFAALCHILFPLSLKFAALCLEN